MLRVGRAQNTQHATRNRWTGSLVPSESSTCEQDMCRGCRADAAETLRQTGARASDLRRTALAAQLSDQIDQLIDTVGPDRVTACLAAAAGRKRYGTAG